MLVLLAVPLVSSEIHNFSCIIAAIFVSVWCLSVLHKLLSYHKLFSSLHSSTSRVLLLQSEGLKNLRDILLTTENNLQNQHLQQLLRSFLEQHDVTVLETSHVHTHLLPDSKFITDNSNTAQLTINVETSEENNESVIALQLFCGVSHEYVNKLKKRFSSQNRNTETITGVKIYVDDTDKYRNRTRNDFGDLLPKDYLYEKKHILRENKTEIPVDLDWVSKYFMESEQRYFCVSVLRLDDNIHTSPSQVEVTVYNGNCDPAKSLQSRISSVKVVEQFLVNISERNLIKYEDIFGVDSYRSKNDDGFECVACYMKPRSVLMLPCKHICVCDECFEKLDKCPLCRTPMTENIRWDRHLPKTKI